jgi:hypothetical protein
MHQLNAGWRMRHASWTLALGCCVWLFSSGASAQDTSTSTERAKWVEVSHKLESAPLDDSVNQEGEAALKRLSDVHDVHVPLCPSLLSEFNGMKYAYAHTITRQYMLASGAFQIENPDKAADTKATISLLWKVFSRPTAPSSSKNRMRNLKLWTILRRNKTRGSSRIL